MICVLCLATSQPRKILVTFTSLEGSEKYNKINKIRYNNKNIYQCICAQGNVHYFLPVRSYDQPIVPVSQQCPSKTTLF